MQFLNDTFFPNINFVCRMGGFFSAPPNSGWKLGKATFEQSKFYYITEGSCHIWINGQYYLAQPGDWFYIPADMDHGYSSHEKMPLRKHWMHFDLYPKDALPKNLELPVMIHVPDSKREKVERCFQDFAESFHASNLTHMLEAKAAGIRLFAMYVELAFPDGLPILQDADHQLMSLLAYIQKNLALPLTNGDLAQMLHLHPIYFCQWFRDRVGVPPQQYLLQTRLEAGKQLLEKSEKSIGQIAQETGFYDASHFSHAFRRCFSMSPSQYRVFSKRNTSW